MTNHLLLGIYSCLLLFFSLPTYAFATKNTRVCVRIVEHNEELPPIAISPKKPPKENPIDPSIRPNIEAHSKTEAGGNADKATGNKTTEETEKTAGPAENTSKETVDIVSVPSPPVPPVADTQKTYTQKEAEAIAKKYVLAQQTRQTIDGESNLPVGQTAFVYLKRLIEHYVTHNAGYVSVDKNCAQTITVELYPLERGWTAFARYTGTNREEKIDELYNSELNQFAERAVTALLEDVPISATINRENVLKSDSKKSVQRIKGSNHFILSVGTQLKGAWVDQAITSGENTGGVEKKIRIFHPMKFALGYRGRFESWGLETTLHLGLGMGKTAAASNPQGGHVDYGGDAGTSIHFLRYFDPRGLISFYLGSGATFEFVWFSIIRDSQNGDSGRDYTFGGGLSADAVFGWEFLRAAAVQFYLQGEINLPAYITRAETNYGEINSWMPGFSVKLGVVF